MCQLRQQRLQLLKYMMYNGDAMFIARMILNTTLVTAHDAEQLLAVSKCELVYQYYLADRSGSCH